MNERMFSALPKLVSYQVETNITQCKERGVSFVLEGVKSKVE